MRRSGLTIVFLTLLAGAASSAGWERSVDLGLTLNQASYSDSWTGGESGSITWAFTSDLSAARQMSPILNWKNTGKLSYGQTLTQAENAQRELRWRPPKKSSDRIFYESLLRFTLGRLVDPFAAVTFESQFYDGTVPTVRRYVNPMLISEAAGVGRQFTKTERTEFYSRLGFAVRENVHRDVVSLEPKRLTTRTDTDGGIDWTTDFSHAFGPQMKYVTKLRVFKALFNSTADEPKDRPADNRWKSVDFAWENSVSAAIAKYVQVQFFAELLYDKEIDSRGRFRETLGLGLAYKLF
jgi:hypothetical protein